MKQFLRGHAPRLFTARNHSTENSGEPKKVTEGGVKWFEETIR
jgi:hypothetical protein